MFAIVLSIFEKVNFIWDGFDFNPNIDKHKIISMKVKFYLNFYFLPENSRISKKFVVKRNHAIIFIRFYCDIFLWYLFYYPIARLVLVFKSYSFHFHAVHTCSNVFCFPPFFYSCIVTKSL